MTVTAAGWRALSLAGVLLVAAFAVAETDPWEAIAPGGATRCATGKPYIFHVREADPARLMIFFNGGGACWNAGTCDPDGEPTYRTHAGPGSGNDPREYGGAFDLANPENPFRDWSQMFVSYCTGDVHLGAATARYPAGADAVVIEHAGRANAEAALAEAYRRFPEAAEILVAGALASPVYAAEVAAQYPSARVTQLGAGAAGYRLPPPAMLWEAWGVVPALPAFLPLEGVTAASLEILDLYALAGAAAPRIRFHSYDNAYDAVQEQFHALLGRPVALLPGLDANLDDLHAALPYFRNYVAGGEFHTLLRYDELYTRETAGVRALDWVRAAIGGEGAAPNVHCGCDGECRGP